MFRRLAFHKSGKPRGWFRAIAISKSTLAVRPLFLRAFFKKNGMLRPDLAAYIEQNPHYSGGIFSAAAGKIGHSAVEANVNPEAVARDLFRSQQAELTSEGAAQLIAGLAQKPLISIIMPVYRTPVQWLRRAVESLQEQYYDHWELCVVDDCSPSDDQRKLLSDLASHDPRIRLAVMPRNGGISAASNMALDMAQGEFIALVDHDDELTPDALLRMVEAINGEAEADFLYSDECKIDDTPARELFHFVLKPDWSPEIMLNFMITGHLTVYRTDLVRQIGGFRTAYDFSQDYDLALRMAEVSRKVLHVERILYLWRAISGSAAAGGKDFARETNVAALADALARRGIPGIAEIEPHANRVRITIPDVGSRVSIVIPSDSAKNLRLALDAIRKGTDYENYELRVVCNSKVATELEGEYRDWPAANFVRYDKPYNFSDKCNEGARAADGDIVIFYNDDVFPLERDWIERLIEYLWVPGVGATSPQLLYPDDTIQYAGMISGTPGMAGTAYHKRPRDSVDAFLSMNRLVRNISILSGACCAMRKELFFKVGGFDPLNTPDGHSDLDLSYKILSEGLRCVYTPYSVLRHIGNHSWNAKGRKYKADIFCLKRWGSYVSKDPYFTNSMKQVLYGDFTFDYRIFAGHIDPRRTYSGPDVLFVSHELSHTGAPHMLLEAAKAVRDAGGFPVVVAPADGPLRGVLEREEIVVIIDQSIMDNHFLFERFARNFDLAIVNTVALRQVVEQLATIPVLRTLWWLHESEALSSQLDGMPSHVWSRVSTVCVSSYAKSFLPKHILGYILHNGLPDHAPLVGTVGSSDKLTFLMVGTIEPRKGQDLFVNAILGLPSEIRADCRFIIAGKLWSYFQEFWEEISPLVSSTTEISYVGDLPYDEVLKLIAGCDALVCCSRDDAFGLVVVEAAQMEKPSIVSNHVGAREVLGEGCSFVFPSGDVEALRACLLTAYNDRDLLRDMGRASRRAYEEHLTRERFDRNFIALVEAEIARQ
jgi:GT2 family glycosyltransferase